MKIWKSRGTKFRTPMDTTRRSALTPSHLTKIGTVTEFNSVHKTLSTKISTSRNCVNQSTLFEYQTREKPISSGILLATLAVSKLKFSRNFSVLFLDF